MPERESRLFAHIYEAVKQVPRGRVASYGQIAQLVGEGCDARMVGYAMAGTPEGQDIPWQRIINREGKISLPGKGGVIQRMRLEAEGVVFDTRGRIEMQRFGWQGPGPADEPKPSAPEQPSLF
jgi:methylated-DNA-protein-cysteine methyltransferase-like protein